MNGLHKWRWRFMFAWLVVFTVLTARALHRADEAARANHQLALRTNMSLCTLRGDLEQRIRSSQSFLLTHPSGLDGLVSAATIRRGILNEQRTVDSLSNLDCKEGN